MHTINIAQKFSQFSEMWSPKILGEVNETYIKAVKFTGEFGWHHHENEDEMVLVAKARVRRKVRAHEDLVRPGKSIIGPRGVDHLPVSDEETQVLLFEPKS